MDRDFVVIEAENAVPKNKTTVTCPYDKEILQRFQHNKQVAIFVLSPWKFEYLNHGVVQLTGYCPWELRQMDFLKIVHPEMQAALKRSFRDGLAYKDVKKRQEITLVTKNGEKRRIDASFQLIKYRNKKAILGTAIDVTDKQVAQNKIFQTKERLNRILESIDEAFLSIDSDWSCFFTNQKATDLFNQRTGDKLGGTFFRKFSALEGKGLRNTLQKAMETGEHGTVEVLCKPLNRCFEAKVYPAEGGISVLFRDITDGKHAQRAYAGNKKRFVRAQELAKMGDWEWDIVEGEVRLSDVHVRILGYKPGEFEPSYERLLECMHPDDRQIIQENVQKGLERKISGFDEEFRILTPDGTVKHVLSRGHFVIDDKGDPVKLIGTMQDITDQRKAQEALRLSYSKLRSMASKLESVRENEKKRIAMRLHDELGQDLLAINSQLYTVIEKLESKQPMSQAELYLIKKLYNIVSLNAKTIDTVRNISQELSPLILEKLGLVPALETLLEIFSNNHSDIVAEGSFSVDKVELNKEFCLDVYRVIQESLTNIAKHSEASRVWVSVLRRKKSLMVEIRDNGKGMPVNQGNQRAGMGLYHIQERINKWRGQLNVKSAENKGTSIILTIPYPLALQDLDELLISR